MVPLSRPKGTLTTHKKSNSPASPSTQFTAF